ncbi:MAG TPA: surface-adhesin E family protein [Caldimonas sp.]
MIKFRLFALAAFLAPTLACAAQWDKVGDTSLASVYVDKDSMRRSGSEVRAALEWRWNSPTEVPDTGGEKTYRLERQVQTSNCAHLSYAVAEGTRYADQRGIDLVSSYKYDERSLPYMEARPRTIRDTIIAHVCRAAPQPKKP